MKAASIRIALAALALALPTTAVAASHTPPHFFGVDWPDAVLQDPSTYTAQFTRMAVAGVETVRLDFPWVVAQPSEGGPFDFSTSDAVVRAASTHHVTVLPVVTAPPAWARDSSFANAPPRHPSEYGSYLAALVHRYGPRGTFWSDNPGVPRMPVRAWEIWNEENQPGGLYPAGHDWLPIYSGILKAGRKAVKSADPGATVVLGSLTNFSFRDLKRIYQAGLRRDFDVVAINPYTAHAPVTVAELNRAVMQRNGDAHKPIWVTELGLPAVIGQISNLQTGIGTTDAGMAQFLHETYLSFAAVASRLALQRVYWFTWQSTYTGHTGSDFFNYAGLLKVSGGTVSRRPAYTSYVRVARRLEGCTKNAFGACTTHGRKK